jgi:putative copper resistance protein D
MSPESIFLGLLLTRGPHLAALLSAFGCVVFVTFPRGPAPRGLFQTSLGLGIVMGLLWLVVQSADFADGAGPAAVLNAIPVVAFQTRFGQWLLIRLALMMIAWACFRTRRPVAALIILVPAIAAESRFSHAGAALGRDWVETLAPAMATLHLLAAGAWLGGLLPLRHLLAWAPERAIPVVRRFSVLGIAAVGTIAVTAAWQAALEVGGLAGWVGTGRVRHAHRLGRHQPATPVPGACQRQG